MSQCTQCENDGYRYDFSTTTADFNLAQQSCANNGGTLARYLDNDAYMKLRQCCQNGLNYWIGLFENRNCSSSLAELYTWVADTVCTSGSPLNIVPSPNSAVNSQAITVLLNSNNLAQPPDAKEVYDYEKHRYICQYPRSVSTAAETSSPTTVSTDDAVSFSTKTDTSSFVETTITYPASSSSTTQLEKSTSIGSTVTATSSVITSTTTRFDTLVPHETTGLIVGLVVGGVILIIALLFFCFLCIRNKYFKKFKSASRHTTTASFIPNNGKNSNTKEVKKNPLYGRVVTTSDTYQVCHGVNNGSVTGLGSKTENDYQMGDDEDSNEYHAIPRHTNNDPNPASNYYVIPDPSKPSVKYSIVQKKKKNPDSSKEYNIPGKLNNTSSHSNEYELDCVENNYNKLYFPQLQDDATSSIYARLNHKNNAPRSNNTNIYAITP